MRRILLLLMFVSFSVHGRDFRNVEVEYEHGVDRYDSASGKFVRSLCLVDKREAIVEVRLTDGERRRILAALDEVDVGGLMTKPETELVEEDESGDDVERICVVAPCPMPRWKIYSGYVRVEFEQVCECGRVKKRPEIARFERKFDAVLYERPEIKELPESACRFR